MHFSSHVESLLGLGVLAMVAIGIANAVKQTHRRKEMEHAERMKSLEMGLTPLPSGLDWPAASICIAVGAGVPIGSFIVTWLATVTSEVPDEIWFAPALVSFAAIGSTRKLAFRIIDPKSGLRVKKNERVKSFADKPAFDPDAYDVVGSRGA